MHEGYIEALAAERITRGCDDDRYCPTDDISRGQMAAFLRRALELPATSKDYFRDDDGSLFEGDINAIAAEGLTRGCGEGRFCADRPVTRGEMAAFLRRADGLPASSTDHFRDDDGSIFEADINAIADAGITNGCGDGRFCPDDPTQRDQMASFLGRLVHLTPTPPPPPSDARSASDPGSMSVRDAIRAWFPDQYEHAVRVADCESGLNPRAVGSGKFHGLYQISDEWHRDAFKRVTGQSWGDGIYVPYYNAEYAAHLHAKRGWQPWPVCGSG